MTGYQWRAKNQPTVSAAQALGQWSPGATTQTRPPCTSVSIAARTAWDSDNPDARALAREACKSCPIQLTCVRSAVQSDKESSVYGGFDFAQPGERKLARQWLAAHQKRRAS